MDYTVLDTLSQAHTHKKTESILLPGQKSLPSPAIVSQTVDVSRYALRLNDPHPRHADIYPLLNTLGNTRTFFDA